MASAPGEYNISSNVWTEVGSKALTKNFKVEWLKLAELNFTKTLHIKNPLNNNKPVKISRDGQELPTDVALQLIQLIDAEPDTKNVKKLSYDIPKEKESIKEKPKEKPKEKDRPRERYEPREGRDIGRSVPPPLHPHPHPSDSRPYNDRERRINRDFDLLDMTYDDYLKSVKLHAHPMRGFTAPYLPVPFPFPDIHVSPYIPFIPPRQYYDRDERDFLPRDAYYHERRIDDRRKRPRELIDEREPRHDIRHNREEYRNFDPRESRKDGRRSSESSRTDSRMRRR